MTTDARAWTVEGKGAVGERMLFVGGRTAGSAALSLFPGWASELGLTASLTGVDLPLGASSEDYRKVIRRVAADERIKGALITTHKVGVYEACGRDFGTLTHAASRLKEVGVIYKDCAGVISADANDFFSTREVSSALIRGRQEFADEGNVLILGAGGAGTALAHTLSADTELSCKLIKVLDVDENRVAMLRDKVVGWDNPVPVMVGVCGQASDPIVREMPVGSLIANATGLGKDRPGSPLTSKAVFPKKSVAWDFNYRFVRQDVPGFLEIAEAQVNERRLVLEDGWRYFLWGWAYALSRVFHLPGPQTVFAAIAAASPRGGSR